MPNVKNKVRLCTTSPMSQFIVENIGGTPFYNRRSDFERLLEKFVTNPRYKNFFAMPYFEPALHGIEWFVDPEFAQAVKLQSLVGTEQYRAAKRQIVEATNYFKTLMSRANEQEQQYLKCLINYDYSPNVNIDEIAFVSGSKVILGVWGIRPMPGQSLTPVIVTDVEDTRLHRVSFDVTNGKLQGTASFMRRHGYKLNPNIDVPKILPEEGFKFVRWAPFDPNNAQVNDDMHFEAQCEKVATPPPFVPKVEEAKPLPDVPEIVPDVPEPVKHQVIFEPGEGGTLSGPPAVITVPHGTVLDASMVPMVSTFDRYTFLKWDKPIDKPITGDTTFVAQYKRRRSCWRWWRWLLLALLILLSLLILAIVLTRCTSCSGTFGGCVRDTHDRIVGDADNGNRGRIRDITRDEDGNPIDHWDDGDNVIPPLTDDNGELIPPVDNLDPDDPNSPRVVSNRLNVFFEDDNPDFQKFATEFKRVYPGEQYKIIGKDKETRWLLIEVPPEERPKIRDELPSKIPSIKFKVVDEVIMNGGQSSLGSSATNLPKGWHLEAAKIKQAWQITKGNSDVVVAVVDDGIDMNHEMFRGRLVKPYNVFSCDEKLDAGIGHGTHVAGLAAGSADRVGQGAAGVAPNCKIMPVQVFDHNQCTISGVIRGIMYAVRNDADVVNISIGMNFPIDPRATPPINEQKQVADRYFKPAEDVWKWVFDQASKKNTILVFAAGNNHLLAAIQPQLRSANTINVGALGQNNIMTEWSNFGKTVYVTAPGAGIYSSMPGNRYEEQDGTSMAAPIVTGIVALMKSVNKNVTVSQATSALVSTGVSIRNGNESGPAVQADKAVNKIKQL